MARLGSAWSGRVGPGQAGLPLDVARHVAARHGTAGLGMATSWQGWARHGRVGPGRATSRHGRARLGKARRGAAGPGYLRAWLGTAWHGWARPGAAWQGRQGLWLGNWLGALSHHGWYEMPWRAVTRYAATTGLAFVPGHLSACRCTRGCTGSRQGDSAGTRLAEAALSSLHLD